MLLVHAFSKIWQRHTVFTTSRLDFIAATSATGYTDNEAAQCHNIVSTRCESSLTSASSIPTSLCAATGVLLFCSTGKLYWMLEAQDQFHDLM